MDDYKILKNALVDGKLTDILFGEITDVVIVIHVRSLLSFDCHKYTRFRGVCQ